MFLRFEQSLKQFLKLVSKNPVVLVPDVGRVAINMCVGNFLLVFHLFVGLYLMQ